MITHKLIARNHAADHANRIHSDETARRYGFTGALVPGVSVYSYMLEPVVAVLGDAWIGEGSANVKFLKPIYDGSDVTVQMRPIDRLAHVIEARDGEDNLCAVGNANLSDHVDLIDAANYPLAALPDSEHRRAATADSLPKGDILGSLTGEFNLDRLGAEFGSAVRYPALLLALANDVVSGNVNLGPWIHTSSDVKHFGVLESGEPMSLRGRVEDSGIKRGHDFVTLDLGLFGRGDRPIAKIRHSALIRLREPEASET